LLASRPVRFLARTLLLALVIAAPASCGAIYDLDALGVGGVDGGAAEAGDAERPPRFCELAKPKPTFCADFDGEDPLAGWDNKRFFPDPFVHGGGRFAGAVRSRDGSLAWSTEVAASNSAASASLGKYLAATRPVVFVGFDVSVEGTDPTIPDERVAIGFIAIGSSETTYVGQVTLAYDRKGGLYVGVSPADPLPADGMFVPSPVGRGFPRIALALERNANDPDAGSGGFVEVFVEGTKVVRTGIPKILATRDDLLIVLGTYRPFKGADARVILDNVIIDLQ
jgi:hypothetical protein